ncbi:GNAT family N-acetyltransferase [Catellatospora sichuanensis]|uniref:GNAT family N-acetyltransferase n=1 Tax=Catellatospora sichuanensis TaxID=1969805 RepID=UPI001183BC6B|nr:GNAT family N-acetyltransferase [Catellatospora sichuanensis]
MGLRAYTGPDDDEQITRVRQAAQAVDGDVWLPGPGDDVPDDACVVAEDAGEVVGFGRLDRWTEDDGTEMFLVTGCVHPAHRGRGHGTAMLRRQEAYAASIGSGAPHQVLGGNADDSQPGARQLLLDHGYRVAFTLVDLSRPVADAAAPSALPPGLRTRPVLAEHQPQIHAAITECFTDSRHGFVPVDYDTHLAAVRDTELWAVAWDGDEIAGLVTSEREGDGVADSPWVAVRPAYRRKGLASALLTHSLAAMRKHGVAVATIRTVAENPHRTVDLYERSGYRIVRRMPRYRKPLAAASA